MSSTYTYLLADISQKEAIIIDPVLEHAKRDAQLIKELGFTLKYARKMRLTSLSPRQRVTLPTFSLAVNTHMHADHVTGTGFLKQLLPGSKSVISKASGALADQYLEHSDTVEFGRHRIKAVATPGHTSGCMTFIVEEQASCCDCFIAHRSFLLGQTPRRQSNPLNGRAKIPPRGNFNLKLFYD